VNEQHGEDERTFVFELAQKEEDVIAEKEEIHQEIQEPAMMELKTESMPENRIKKPDEIKPFEVYIKKPGGEAFHGPDTSISRPSVDLKSQERIERLRNLSMKFKNDSAIEELENEPAYIRRNVELKNTISSGESQISRYSLYESNDGKGLEIRSGNSYLHDNVD
jgi:hypothetical protein